MTSRVVLNSSFGFSNCRGTKSPSLVLSPISTGTGFLDDVISSVVADLDATIAASYTSGQTWANLIASPNDGAAQADYDFYLGLDGSATTTDPTFTGTVGDPTAYFEYDGGDVFTIKGGNPLTAKNLHKTHAGNSWWIAMSLQIPGTTAFYPFSTTNGGTSANGFGLRVQGNERIYTIQRGNSVTTSYTFDNGVNTFPVSTDTVFIVSYNQDTSTLTQWINSNTSTKTINPFFVTSTTDPVELLTIGARPDGIDHFSNLTRMYSFAMGNEFLDDTKAAAIIAHLEARHNRTYT